MDVLQRPFLPMQYFIFQSDKNGLSRKVRGRCFILYVFFCPFNFEFEIPFFFINVSALSKEKEAERKWRGAYLSAPQLFQSELKTN